MKQSFTLKSFLVILFLLSGLKLQAELSKEIYVETAGTISSFIPNEEKNLITNLTVTGNLNGTDLRYIREMAGTGVLGSTTPGQLTALDLSGADIVAGGVYYLTNATSKYYTSDHTIGEFMFAKTNLTSLVLPNSATSIADHAFNSCWYLTTITIPKNVTTIGTLAFYDAPKLSELTVSEENTHYSSVDGILFNKNKTELISCPIMKSGSYTIPEGTISIDSSAFRDCAGLTSVTIPNSVTTLAFSAFYKCSSLTSVTIGTSVTSIGSYAFEYCRGLTSVTIPNSVTSIGTYAFEGCVGLTSVTFGTSVTSIGRFAFSSCVYLKKIYNNNLTPQTLEAYALGGFDKSSCTLYVPIGAKANYLAANEWKDFGSIVEVDITSTNQPEADVVKVYTEGESIVVEGVQSGKEISIYTQAGAIIQTLKATDDRVKIKLPINAIYLVKTANRTFKVAL